MNLQKYAKENGICCATCWYINTTNGNSTCRINPITIGGYDQLLSTTVPEWPKVENKDTDWCAKHPDIKKILF